MDQQISEPQKMWRKENTLTQIKASEENIAFFESRNNVKLPSDLREYFLALNGTGSII